MRLALAIVSLAFILVTLAGASFVSETEGGGAVDGPRLAGVGDLPFGEDRSDPYPSIGSTLRVGNALVISGQVGRNEHGWGEGASDQAEIAFRNLRRTLAESGATLGDVVEITTYIVVGTEPGPLHVLIEREFSGRRMAWAPIEVARLDDPRCRIELRAVAVLPGS